MTTANECKETESERTKNVPAFRYQYGRLNSKQQQKVQSAFCKHHELTPGGFRGRMAGTVRVSESELAWIKAEVARYFPSEAPVEAA